MSSIRLLFDEQNGRQLNRIPDKLPPVFDQLNDFANIRAGYRIPGLAQPPV